MATSKKPKASAAKKPGKSLEESLLTKPGPKVLKPNIPKLKINLSPPAKLILLIIIAAVASSGYFGWQYFASRAELSKLKSNPQEITRVASEELINKVGALVALPENEQPTIATVTGIEKLKNQPFFAQAKNGDKVLIYTQAKKAYLYDPVANKILNVAPLNIGSPAPTPTLSPSPNPSPEPSPNPQE